jgi:membrane associated rhomboid family serine protease
MMSSQAVLQGEWWRLFTAVTLHADLSHLMANVTTGVLLLGLAMGIFGSGYALLCSFLAGAGANALALLIYPVSHRSLGASGMIMGALGMLSAQSVGMLRHGVPARYLVMRSVIGGMLLLVLFGLNPQSDVMAHMTGFGIGLILGAILSFFPAPWVQNPKGNRAAEAICAALVCLTWFLALR